MGRRGHARLRVRRRSHDDFRGRLRADLVHSGAIAHDFYVNWIKGGHIAERQQVWIARVSAVVIGILAIALGILAQGVNVAVLVILRSALRQAPASRS